MTNPGNPGTGDAGGQPGTGSTGGGAPQGNGGPATGTPPADSWADADAWKALAEEFGETPDQVRARLQHARQWEDRAKSNRTKAQQADTLAGEVEQLRKAQADRDAADLSRSLRTAGTELRAALVERGLTREDAAEAIEDIDRARLLKDGEPDDAAIAKVADRLAKVAGRPTPDPDQGKGAGTGGDGKADMNSWVRDKARGRR